MGTFVKNKPFTTYTCALHLQPNARATGRGQGRGRGRQPKGRNAVAAPGSAKRPATMTMLPMLPPAKRRAMAGISRGLLMGRGSQPGLPEVLDVDRMSLKEVVRWSNGKERELLTAEKARKVSWNLHTCHTRAKQCVLLLLPSKPIIQGSCSQRLVACGMLQVVTCHISIVRWQPEIQPVMCPSALGAGAGGAAAAGGVTTTGAGAYFHCATAAARSSRHGAAGTSLRHHGACLLCVAEAVETRVVGSVHCPV